MTVADHGHVVVAVEIAPAVGIEQPDTLAADQVHRMVVEQRRPGQHKPAPLQQTGGGGPAGGQAPAGFPGTPPARRLSPYPRAFHENAGPRAPPPRVVARAPGTPPPPAPGPP